MSGLDIDEHEGDDTPLQRAIDEHMSSTNPKIESLQDLGNVFLNVQKSIDQQTAMMERLVRSQQRGASNSLTLGGAQLHTATLTIDFHGTLDELSRKVSSREWSAIDRSCLFPDGMSAEQIEELFPKGQVLVSGAAITYVDSTFPCKLGFDFHQFANLPRTETGGSKKKYHFVVGTRMHSESKHTLLNADDSDADRLMKEHPQYTPSNIDNPNFGVFFDLTNPSKKNLKSDHPAITFAALALGDINTEESMRAQDEMLFAAENYPYVEMDVEQADSAIAEAKRRWSEMMKVTEVKALTTARIERLGYKFNDVEGLSPTGADTLAAMLGRTQASLSAVQTTSNGSTAAALNGSAILRAANKHTSGSTDASAAAASSDLTTAEAYNTMLIQPYNLTMKVEFQVRSPKGSTMKKK